VHELSFTVPSQTIGGSLSLNDSVEIIGGEVGLGGKETGVKANISDQASVKDSRGFLSWDGLRSNSSKLKVLNEGNV
jgi:hypothetical protein